LANVALLVNPNNPSAKREIENMKMAAPALGLQLKIVNASDDHEIDTAFATIDQHPVEALVAVGDPLWSSQGKRVVSLAARRNIPTCYPLREYAQAGGLMSYGASFPDAIRQTGVYVGRVLKGEKPADLPVMQSAKFELVINLKAATALGLTVPDKVLAIADEVIE
jgi:putative ABC transport system substrate-binding protein